MKRYNKLISLLLILSILFSFGTIINADEEGEIIGVETEDDSTPEDKYEQGASGFVSRLYTLTLNRDPDSDGLESWVKLLKDGSNTGAQIAEGFFQSPEFLSRNTTDTEYVRILYHVFFDRDPDEAGFVGWTSRLLSQELNRQDVFDGFVNSQEWANLCTLFGIESGGAAISTVTPVPTRNVKNFVTRLYTLCLDREPDEKGFNGWCSKLACREASGKEVAYGFFFSNEFKAKALTLSDDELITIYYNVFLNRTPDANGLKAWKDILNMRDELVTSYQGIDELFDGFADSVEFAQICQDYGILTGDHIDTPDVPRSIFDLDHITYTNKNTLMDYYLKNNLITRAEINEIQTSIIDQSKYWLQLREETRYPNYVFGGKVLIPRNGVDCSGFVTTIYRRALGTMIPVTSGVSGSLNNSANYVQSMTNYGRANMNGRYLSVYPYKTEGVFKTPDGRLFYIDKFGIASPVVMNTYQWLYYLYDIGIDYTKVDLGTLESNDDWSFVDTHQPGDIILWWDGLPETRTDGDSWHIGIYDGCGGVYHSSSVDTTDFSHNNIGVQHSNINDILKASQDKTTMVIFNCFDAPGY